MTEPSVDEIVQRALTLGILPSETLQDVWASFGSQNVDLKSFLQALLRQGHLTKYQVDRLVSGESTGFYYGGYKVLYPVGAGTFARVFRTVHPETNKVAAIKVLRNRFASDPAAVDLFIREAELGIQLRHPNIVPIYEVKSEHNTYFMIMDFIEGQTLRDYVSIRKKIEPKIATRITTDICQGLDYAFKRGHLHRDLKLSNVLLSCAGQAILVDFGLASEMKDNDQKNQRAIDYAALERSTGVRRDDQRSDIYFLGTMFYQMLTGVAPLGDVRDRSKRLDKGRFLSVRPIIELEPNLPYVLAYIVGKAMQMDPSKRYQTPGEMLVELKAAVKKLEEGTARSASDETTIKRGEGHANPLKASSRGTVLVIESNADTQNVFRESLRSGGYRVLLFSSAERALARLRDQDTAIDCILINAQFLGKTAVLAFNEIAKSPITEGVPSILLLDETQVKWAAKAIRGKHRVAVAMPITMKRLQEVIRKLIHDKKHGQPTLGENPKQASGPGSSQKKKTILKPKSDASGLSKPEKPNRQAAVLSSQEKAVPKKQPPKPTRPVQNASSHTDQDSEEPFTLQASPNSPEEFSTELFDTVLDDAAESFLEKLGLNLDGSSHSSKNSSEGDDDDYIEDRDL